MRVGGGLELVPGGDRYGPADLAHPPPGGPWQALTVGDQLVGWDREGGRTAAKRAAELSERLARDRREYLLGRLSHKLRSALLALQESARGAAFGRHDSAPKLEDVYEQAQEVGRRSEGLVAVAVDPKDPPRAVVLGAVLNLSAVGAKRELPADAVVRVPEPVLVEALTRAYDWLGGAGSSISGRRDGDWWRLELVPAPDRKPLAVPELGEPLVRLLVDSHLGGWLDAGGAGPAAMYLPAYDV